MQNYRSVQVGRLTIYVTAYKIMVFQILSKLKSHNALMFKQNFHSYHVLKMSVGHGNNYINRLHYCK